MSEIKENEATNNDIKANDPNLKDAETEQPKQGSQQSNNEPITLSNGKTPKDFIQNNISNLSQDSQKRALNYLQNRGKVNYYSSKPNPSAWESKRLQQSTQATQKIMNSMAPQDQSKIKVMTQGLQPKDINKLGQEAHNIRHKQITTLSNGMNSEDYVKNSIKNLSPDGQMSVTKYLKDEGLASYYAGQGNQPKVTLSQNQAQHQLNSLSPNDTKNIPVKGFINKGLKPQDIQKIGNSAYHYQVHRTNGWKQAQFFYQAKGRQQYFKNNPQKQAQYKQKAQKEFGNMAPDIQKLVKQKYQNNSLQVLSNKANQWITKRGRYSRNKRFQPRKYNRPRYNSYRRPQRFGGYRNNYNRYNGYHRQYNHHRQGYVYGYRHNGRYTATHKRYQNNYYHNHYKSRYGQQGNMLNQVMGNQKPQHHYSHHNFNNNYQQPTVQKHVRNTPKPNKQQINKQVAMKRKQQSMNNMPF